MSSSNKSLSFTRLPSNDPSSFPPSASDSASSIKYNSNSKSGSTCAGGRKPAPFRYAKDGKGFDFSNTYPYHGSNSSASSSSSSSSCASSTTTSSTTSSSSSSSSAPLSSSSETSSNTPPTPTFKLRYAKDSKGFDFTSVYPYTSAPGPSRARESMDRGMRMRMRYAKDGKGHDFSTSYYGYM